MSSIQYINTITTILVGIFNIGIVTRIITILVLGMTEIEDDINTKKRIKSHIKAVIITNSIVGLVSIIKHYFL